MKPNFITRNLAAILGLMAASVPLIAKTPATNTRLTVRVYDYVNLSNKTESELAENARRILAQAGIAVELALCFTGGLDTGEPGCIGPLGPADLILRIVQRKFAVRGEQLGYASMSEDGGAYITVLVNPAERKARVGALSDGSYLGHAVAHEIGHLLLGTNEHSSTGIMRPVWRVCDEEWMSRGLLFFDARQASRMRERLIARIIP